MKHIRIGWHDLLSRTIVAVLAAVICSTVGVSALEQTPMEPICLSIPWSQEDSDIPDKHISIGYGTPLLDNEPVPVIYYSQADPKYANQPFGSDKIITHGCGPTAMAMVVSSLTDRPMDPAQMAKWAYENGYWYARKGSLHELIPGAAKAWGLDVVGYQAEDADHVWAALQQKKLVVALMWPGHFTASGHFIVLCGLDADGKVVVADPASRSRSEVSWDFQLIVDEAAESAGANGPFWVIG